MTEEFANRYISILYRYGQRFFAQSLRERGLALEAGQIPALMQVLRNPGITQEGISQVIGMDKGTTARSVQELERLGYIRREVDGRDRRVNHMFLTEAGECLRAPVYRIIRELHQVQYQGFTREEIALAVEMLLRMKDNMARRLGEKWERSTDSSPAKPGSR